MRRVTIAAFAATVVLGFLAGSASPAGAQVGVTAFEGARMIVGDGSSGKPGKRLPEVTARRRTLPACTTALAAAIELIITWLTPLATSCAICAAER